MSEILNSLGVDLPLLAVQVVNFLILLFILKKFLYRPILETINSRKQEIQKGLELKTSMEERKQQLEKEKERILQETREEAQLLMKRKKKEADKVKTRLLKEAREEKEEIIKEGQKKLEKEKKEMRSKLEAEVIELAAEMAQKTLVNLLTKKDQEEIIREELQKLSTSNFKD